MLNQYRIKPGTWFSMTVLNRISESRFNTEKTSVTYLEEIQK